MKNVFKRIFTFVNFEAGLLITILLLTISLSISVMGWKILFIPITIIAIFLLGTIVRYAMDKFKV
jgi:uncharacterized membrane protein